MRKLLKLSRKILSSFIYNSQVQRTSTKESYKSIPTNILNLTQEIAMMTFDLLFMNKNANLYKI